MGMLGSASFPEGEEILVGGERTDATGFILEVRYATILPIERRYLPNKGGSLVTTGKCIALLESAGVIGGK
jgi:hypothetical protein